MAFAYQLLVKSQNKTEKNTHRKNKHSSLTFTYEHKSQTGRRTHQSALFSDTDEAAKHTTSNAIEDGSHV